MDITRTNISVLARMWRAARAIRRPMASSMGEFSRVDRGDLLECGIPGLVPSPCTCGAGLRRLTTVNTVGIESTRVWQPLPWLEMADRVGASPSPHVESWEAPSGVLGESFIWALNRNKRNPKKVRQGRAVAARARTIPFAMPLRVLRAGPQANHGARPCSNRRRRRLKRLRRSPG